MAARLLVYLHLAVKQRALQEQLGSGLPGIDVMAVGRIADFDRALESAPDAALTLPVVLDARGYKPGLRGLRLGQPDEVYVLVSEGTAPSAKGITSVGAVDLLGRTGTTELVHRLLGASPKVDRVTKVEDLLFLLQLRRVEAIIVPDRLLGNLRSMTRMNLVKTDLSVRMGLPAAVSLTARGEGVLIGIRNLSKSHAQTLGVDAWK